MPDIEEPLLELARAMMAISLHAADRVGGTSVVQLRALTVLGRRDLVDLDQLCDRLEVDVSTGQRLADRLVAAGLVERGRGESGGRQTLLRLTRRGRSVLADFDRSRLQAINERLSALPEHHRLALDGCGEALREAVHRLAEPQSPPLAG